MTGHPKRTRGRPKLPNALNIALTIHVNQTLHDMVPKNEKGNPSQDWLREAIEEKGIADKLLKTSGGVE